jgi:hypothetical protein
MKNKKIQCSFSISEYEKMQLHKVRFKSRFVKACILFYLKEHHNQIPEKFLLKDIEEEQTNKILNYNMPTKKKIFQIKNPNVLKEIQKRKNNRTKFIAEQKNGTKDTIPIKNPNTEEKPEKPVETIEESINTIDTTLNQDFISGLKQFD